MPIITKRDGDAVEMQLYGDVGFYDIDASDFGQALARHADAESFTVRINSYGGDVFEGVAIYERLRGLNKRKTVMIDGVAASAASLIAMGGDEIIIAESAFMMIHRAWGVAVGDGDEVRRLAALLDKIDSTLISAYAKRTGQDEGAVRSAVEAETWYTSDEAIAFGLADKKSDDSAEPSASASSQFRQSKAAKKMPGIPAAAKGGRLRAQAESKITRMEMNLSAARRRSAA